MLTMQIPHGGNYVEQLTPPETPPMLTIGCGKSVVGNRTVNAGVRLRVASQM